MTPTNIRIKIINKIVLSDMVVVRLENVKLKAIPKRSGLGNRLSHKTMAHYPQTSRTIKCRPRNNFKSLGPGKIGCVLYGIKHKAVASDRLRI